MANDNDSKLFNIGTELDATYGHEAEWRAVIAAVRAVAPNTKLFYGCNWYPNVTAVNFWDALDYIGVDAYYPLTDHINPTLEEVKAGWVPIMQTLAETSAKFDKKVIFAEVGYASFDQAPISPNLCC